jgi:transposase-like protein
VVFLCFFSEVGVFVTKLTDDQRKSIIAAVANGESKRSLARQYEVSDTTVRRVCNSDPQMAQKVAHKKAENEASVLAHMDTQKSQVCEGLDRLLKAVFNDDKIDAATLVQLATTLGILIDKYTNNEVVVPSLGGANNLFSAIVESAGEELSTDDIPEIEQAAAAGDDVVEPPTV